MTPQYAAGLIDGEGYIGIQESGGSFQVRLKVAMTDKGRPALEALSALFGGRVRRDRDATGTNRSTVVWVVTGTSAVKIVSQLRPMLLVKAEAADIALEFGRMHEALPTSPRRGRLWDAESLARASMLRARIQEANRRGPDPAPPRLPEGLTPRAQYRWGWWWEPEEDLFGPVELQGKLPASGLMVSGHVYATPRPEATTSPGLPTPRARDWKRGGKDGVENALLPTPRTSDTNGPGHHGQGGGGSEDRDLGAVSLLPTPRATDGTKGGPNQRGSSGDLMLPSAVLLPTPTATDRKASGGNPHTTATHGTTLTDATVRQAGLFGQYAPAIARWETVLGRPAPAPTEPTGRGGAERLAPRFVEWMMGLPDGWVTGAGLTRNEQLKALGNGVVPQQAAAAIQHLLDVRAAAMAGMAVAS